MRAPARGVFVQRLIRGLDRIDRLRHIRPKRFRPVVSGMMAKFILVAPERGPLGFQHADDSVADAIEFGALAEGPNRAGIAFGQAFRQPRTRPGTLDIGLRSGPRPSSTIQLRAGNPPGVAPTRVTLGGVLS